MNYRTLGKTDLNVSVFGYGAAPLGNEFGSLAEEEGEATVHAAFDAGVNFYDTSPYYGRTLSETRLGKALSSLPRAELIIATKVGRYGRDEFDFAAATVESGFHESLKRLQTDYVDLIQCHDIEFGSLQQVVEETLPALRRLQAQGLARYVGITGLPLHALQWVLERAEVDTVLSYCHYSLNDDSFSTLFPALQARAIGTINASPLGMGLLTEAGPPEWHPAPDILKTRVAQAATLCRERGSDISTLGMQYVFQQSAVASTLSGSATREQLKRNLACLDNPPDPTLLADVQAILAPVHNTTWPSGLPENNG